jgi:large exoprotein involved in heme utilization and adhesion
MQGFTDISSDTFLSGPGGEILVEAGTIALSGPATISTSTFGSGAGGSLRLDADERISISAGARVLSTSGDGRTGPGDPENPITGAGGSISLSAPTIEIVEGAVNTSSFTAGDAGNIIIDGGRLLLDNFSLLTSATFVNSNGGTISIDVGELSVRGGSRISADSFCVFDGCASGGGDAGDITIDADRVELVGFDDADFGPVRSGISSNTETSGRAGDITIRAGELVLDQADIGSQTIGQGDAGTITLEVGTLALADTSAINTNSAPCPPNCDPSFEAGDAGDIGIVAGDISVSGGSIITSSTDGSGDAGTIGIVAEGRILLDDGHITTVTTKGSTGRSGIIAIDAGELVLLSGTIRTNSNSAREAGGILIDAPRITLVGEDAAISSANTFDGVGDAGAIFMTTEQLALLDGARLSTASLNGAAGTIEIFMPETGLLLFQSRGTPSLITTSSGPGTGGRIFIARPRAIITNGGQILALGQEGGANVQIATDFFIRSADRFNRVAVDGAFLLEATVGDISSGTVNRDLSVIDASGVLRGQCASVRSSGQVSQLVVRPIGPYGDRAAPAATPPPETGGPTTGTCF